MRNECGVCVQGVCVSVCKVYKVQGFVDEAVVFVQAVWVVVVVRLCVHKEVVFVVYGNTRDSDMKLASS